MNGTEQTPRILSIDDDGSVRALLKALLEGAGYVVHQAANGSEGMALARETLPALILLDVQMPGLSGFDVCQQLKSDPHLCAIPVIMCTAESNKEDLIRAIRAGADDYLIKPVVPEQLLHRVQRTLSTKASDVVPATLANELRKAARRATSWHASWSTKGIPGFAPAYKCRVLDISVRGMAFRFNRCLTCTGYEQGTVHPQCLFAPVARRFPQTPTLEFILSIKADVVIEVRGKIAHVFQPADTPQSERVGVEFVDPPAETVTLIENYVADKLAL